MQIEFLIGWRNYPKGRQFEFADGMAAELIRRGIVRRVAAPAVEMATNGAAMTAETATRRGRPRKR